MLYTGFSNLQQDPSGAYRVSACFDDLSTIEFKFQTEPTPEQIQAEAEKYIASKIKILALPTQEDNQRIAEEVARRLVQAGYTEEISAALLINKIYGRNPEECDQMNNVRMQIIAQVYGEFGMEMPQ